MKTYPMATPTTVHWVVIGIDLASSEHIPITILETSTAENDTVPLRTERTSIDTRAVEPTATAVIRVVGHVDLAAVELIAVAVRKPGIAPLDEAVPAQAQRDRVGPRARRAALAAVRRVRDEAGLAPVPAEAVAVGEPGVARAHLARPARADAGPGVGGRAAGEAAHAAVLRAGQQVRLAPVGREAVAVAEVRQAGAQGALAGHARGHAAGRRRAGVAAGAAVQGVRVEVATHAGDGAEGLGLWAGVGKG